MCYRYILLQPLLLLITKSSHAAIQSVLHALFLPTPFKVIAQAGLRSPSQKEPAKAGAVIDASVLEMPEEVLKPGALYAECAVVKLDIRSKTVDLHHEEAKSSAKGKEKEAVSPEGVGIEIPDDGELGGEATGRLVWETYEAALKAWEEEFPPSPSPPVPAEEKERTEPTA